MHHMIWYWIMIFEEMKRLQSLWFLLRYHHYLLGVWNRKKMQPSFKANSLFLIHYVRHAYKIKLIGNKLLNLRGYIYIYESILSIFWGLYRLWSSFVIRYESLYSSLQSTRRRKSAILSDSLIRVFWSETEQYASYCITWINQYRQ